MTEHKTLTAALAAFQADLPHLDKGAVNPHFKNAYAPLEDIVKVVLPALAAQGLAWTAAPTLLDGAFVLRYELRHTSGETVEGHYPLSAGNDQQRGSSVTYAKRYALCAVTGVTPGGEDDDGNAAAQAPASRPKPKRDYNGEVAAAVEAKDAKALRGLWKAAQADGAPAEFLDGIRQHVAAIEAAT